jgi:hypothetical protein
MVFKFVVPDYAPGTPGSPVSFHEVGLFVLDQKNVEHLFAVGLFTPPYVKDKDFQLQIVCYLRAPTTGLSVEFEANELADIPAVNYYLELPTANTSGPNLWIVRSARPRIDGGPAMVTKLANGDQWAIVNGSILYTGYAGVQVSSSSLVVPGLTAPVFTSNDLCMVTVIEGAGIHQTRMLRQDLTVDHDFSTVIDKTSLIRIWAGPGCC